MPTSMPESSFQASRRTGLLSFPRYQAINEATEDTFNLVGSTLADVERVATLPPEKPMVASRRRAWDAIDAVHLRYSAGYSAASIAEWFPNVVAYWATFAHFDRRFDASPSAAGRRVPHLDLHDVDYWKAVRLTSFALLLGHAEHLSQIAPLWDYENEELDGLLERLVAPFVSGRAPPPDTCTRHLPYFKLLKVFNAAPEKREALMARYLDEWYTASRREPYFNSHTKGRDHSFLGYWSFEAAAVAYLLDIDDTTFRNHEFYPKDLADFAKSPPRPAVIGGVPSPAAGDPLRLRCLAGQPCPKEGTWFTPARTDSRRHFALGDLMPDIGGTFGATIWQYDAPGSS